MGVSFFGLLFVVLTSKLEIEDVETKKVELQFCWGAQQPILRVLQHYFEWQRLAPLLQSCKKQVRIFCFKILTYLRIYVSFANKAHSLGFYRAFGGFSGILRVPQGSRVIKLQCLVLILVLLRILGSSSSREYFLWFRRSLLGFLGSFRVPGFLGLLRVVQSFLRVLGTSKVSAFQS